MSFDKHEFLEWLSEQDDYYISDTLVREEWPEFYDEHSLIGVTATMDPETGETLIPCRDYRQAVRHGTVLD